MTYLKNLVILFGLSVLTFCAYNPDLGEKLCRLTVASYCSAPKVKDWTCKPCVDSPIKLSNVLPFSNSTGDVLGLIGTSTSPSGIYLVFRGTKIIDLKNWIVDINFIKTKYPNCNNGCQVHQGFYYAYLEIASAVVKTVLEYQSRFGIYNVIVTGHSLGGALATHATAQLLVAGINVEQFYTYGSPRVGDSKFTSWFDNLLSQKTNNKARVTHGRDPVPHLPPSEFGFLHVPHQIFYRGSVREGYAACIDDARRQDRTCSDKYIADVVVTDHLFFYDIDFEAIVLACQ